MFRFGVLCFFTFINTLHGQNMLGEGVWSTISVTNGSDQGLTRETIKMDVNKHRLNRTQDGVSAHVVLTKEVTEAYWMYIDVCKYVDGGCKPYLIITDNIGHLCDKYAKEYVVKALRSSTFETDYFPLPTGEYDLYDYLLDYCSLPSVCLFGKYEVMIYFLLNLQRVACLKMVCECKKCEEGEYCCDR